MLVQRCGRHCHNAENYINLCDCHRVGTNNVVSKWYYNVVKLCCFQPCQNNLTTIPEFRVIVNISTMNSLICHFGNEIKDYYIFIPIVEKKHVLPSFTILGHEIE